MNKAIIIARVSTEEQQEAGNSLPAQLKRMESYCERNNFKVDKTIAFQESAYKDKRDEFDKILKYIKKQKEVIAVCFDKVDRLSRNIFDKRVSNLYEMALKDKIELHFVSDGQVINSSIGATQKFQFGISLGLAKYYSDATSDNTKRALEKKRRNGEWTGPAPYGYKNIPQDKKKRTRATIVPDPVTSLYVIDWYEKYATGDYSLQKLLEEYKVLNLKTRTGKDLHISGLHVILSNPFYYGVARSRKYGEYRHIYEPLVSKELWDRVQKIKGDQNNNPIKKTNVNIYAFSGLMKCKKCGCSITGEKKIKKSGREYTYYSCTNAKNICKREYVNEDNLISIIKADLDKMVLSENDVNKIVQFLQDNHERKVKYHNNKLKELDSAYKALQYKLDHLLDLYVEGKIETEDYERKLNQLKSKQQDIELEKSSYTQADTEYLITAKTVLDLARRAGDIFASSEPEEKQLILKLLLQNPVLNGKNLDYSLSEPFNLIVKNYGNPIGLRE